MKKETTNNFKNKSIDNVEITDAHDSSKVLDDNSDEADTKLELNEKIIFDNFVIFTNKFSKIIFISWFFFFLIIPIFLALVLQYSWFVEFMSFSSKINNTKWKNKYIVRSTPWLASFSVVLIFRVKSKLETYIMKLESENNKSNSKEISYIVKKEIPYLSDDEIGNHYIICQKIDKLVKSLAFSTDILYSIDLTIDKGDIVVILGPSGSGKTTLLNIMAGVDKPTNGHVYIDGKCITDMNDKDITLFRKEKIAYIYQRYGLIPILSVLDNIKIGQELVKKDKRNVDIQDLVSTMGLNDLLEKFPHELSGGQKQRVSISRAIAKQPSVMFCDEPTGALDKENADITIDLFLKLNQKFKTTIIIVTHDNNLVKNANKVLHLKDGKIWKTETFNKKTLTTNNVISKKKV